MTDADNQRNIIKRAQVKRKTIQLKPIRSYAPEKPETPVITPTLSTPKTNEKNLEEAQTLTPEIPKAPPAPELPSTPIITEDEINKQRADMKTQLETEMATYRQELIDAAEAERKTIIDGAHAEGYEAGKEAGQQELKNKAQELYAGINQLAVDRKTVLKKSEKEILELSMEIAKKVIQTELGANTELFSNIFEEALGRVTQKDQVIIKVNPNDAPTVRNYIDAHKKQLNDIKRLEIYEEADIESGGCVIETKLGYIDSSISTKLELIGHAIDEEYKQHVIDTANDTQPEPEAVTKVDTPPLEHNEPVDDFKDPLDDAFDDDDLEIDHDEDFEVEEIEEVDNTEEAADDLEFDDLEIDDF